VRKADPQSAVGALHLTAQSRSRPAELALAGQVIHSLLFVITRRFTAGVLRNGAGVGVVAEFHRPGEVASERMPPRSSRARFSADQPMNRARTQGGRGSTRPAQILERRGFEVGPMMALQGGCRRAAQQPSGLTAHHLASPASIPGHIRTRVTSCPGDARCEVTDRLTQASRLSRAGSIGASAAAGGTSLPAPDIG